MSRAQRLLDLSSPIFAMFALDSGLKLGL